MCPALCQAIFCYYYIVFSFYVFAILANKDDKKILRAPHIENTGCCVYKLSIISG